MPKGTVIKSTGSWCIVRKDDGTRIECRIKGKFRLHGIKATNPVAVGDRVEFDMVDEKTGVVSEVKDRKNYIIREATNLSKQSHVLAANVDQAIIVATVAIPRTSTGFIDRFLVTCEAYGIPGVIIFNKLDLYNEAQKKQLNEFRKTYERIGYPCYQVSSTEMYNLDQIRALVKDKISLIGGHSGVGKSTLLNAIEPGLDLKTGELSEYYEKGMHTTTFSEMIELKEGGFVIDSPGIKEMGLIHIEREELSHYFPEMFKLSKNCKFANCTHVNEPGCAIKEAVESGDIAQFRYQNYLNIFNSIEKEKF